MNINNVVLEESELLSVQSRCGSIEDEDIKNQAIKNMLGVKVFKSIFNDSDADIDTETSLSALMPYTLDLNVSDIYINGSYVSVKLYLEADEMTVPKIDFETDLTPQAYVFIKVSQDLLEYQPVGFILSRNIDIGTGTDDSYIITEEQLLPLDNILDSIETTYDNYSVNEKQIYDYLDGVLDNKQNFYKTLLQSKDARLKLAKAIKAQEIFSSINIDFEDLSDNETFAQDLENNLEDNLESFILNNDSEEENSALEEISNSEESDSFLSDYSTTTSPSSLDIREELDNLENDLESKEERVVEEKNQNVSADEAPSNGEIETLFKEEQEESNQELVENEPAAYKKTKKKSPILLILLILALAGAGGYYFYMNSNNSDSGDLPEENIIQEQNENDNKREDAMPVETVLPTIDNSKNKNEGTAVAIPAIEQNLDASILVSNLKVDWEVPSGYVTNTAAKRYLVKLGKVIQLNLKTELLLLNKPPITNKITVEIKYNNSSKKFETVGIISSSGEESVDKIILSTVNKALSMNISVNTDSFNKLQGNPILIIHF